MRLYRRVSRWDGLLMCSIGGLPRPFPNASRCRQCAQGNGTPINLPVACEQASSDWTADPAGV